MAKRLFSLKVTFRALKFRNFRLFFVGQGISLIGTWMQQIAMGWLVYRLTGSPFLLGLVGFSSQIPNFLFSPIAGVLVDRWNKRHLLLVTQTFSMIQAFLLAALTYKGVITVWHIVILGATLGFINSIDTPARQSFIIDMVERKEVLGNAIALNSFMFNMARLIGPSIAGILIAVTGEGFCFFINGVSFSAVIACLLMMRLARRKEKVKHPNVFHGFKEGFAYTFGFPPIRDILGLLSVISLMGMSYVVLMPVFAKKILRGGPHTLGFLMAAVGIGALVGTLFLASKKNAMKLGRIIPISSIIFGISIILFSFSRQVWLSLLLLVITGFGFMVNTASSNTILQTIVEDDKRGRVMSFYTVAFMGMAPLGSLLAGTLADLLGAEHALIVGGVCCILASLVFAGKIPALKKMVHPIYERLDKVPSIVTGINTVSELAVPPED